MPLLALAVLATTFTIHVGQTRTLVHVRPGDTVVCTGGGDSIRWKATRHTIDMSSWLWDKKLQLNMTPRAHDGFAAECAWL